MPDNTWRETNSKKNQHKPNSSKEDMNVSSISLTHTDLRKLSAQEEKADEENTNQHYVKRTVFICRHLHQAQKAANRSDRSRDPSGRIIREAAWKKVDFEINRLPLIVPMNYMREIS